MIASPPPAPDDVAGVAAQLRRAGLRMTSQRGTVMRALREAGAHPTADVVAEHAQRLDPGLHLATVYRTLHLLESHGLVSHVHLGHGPAVYHLANERHAHAVCSGCGAQVEVAAELLAPLAEALRDQWSFTLDPHHFALAGWCRGCAEHTGDGTTHP